MITIAFILSSVLLFARLGLFVTLHLVPGGIDPIHDTVSDYAASESRRTRRIAAVASWSAAAAWLALGAGILLSADLGSGRMGVGLWLLVLGLVLSLMPAVPTDRSGTATTSRGRLHLLLAVVWFTIAYATIGPLGRLLGGPIGDLLGVANTIGGIALAALVISLVVPALRRRTFGVAERVFIVVVTVAPLIASAELLLRAAS